MALAVAMANNNAFVMPTALGVHVSTLQPVAMAKVVEAMAVMSQSGKMVSIHVKVPMNKIVRNKTLQTHWQPVKPHYPDQAPAPHQTVGPLIVPV